LITRKRSLIKLYEDNKKKVNKALSYSFIFLMLVLLCSAIFLFNSGFKNIDSSRNMLKLSYYENQDYYDTWRDLGSRGEVYSFETWYVLGLKQITYAFIAVVVLCLLLLIPYLRPFTLEIKEKKRKC